jgi:hypothetical protein
LPSPSRPPSSLASSKASKISRNSSPTKQLRYAELEETGFIRASLRDDKKPKSLHALTEELRRINSGFGILPKDLQNEVRVVLLRLLQLLCPCSYKHSLGTTLSTSGISGIVWASKRLHFQI